MAKHEIKVKVADLPFIKQLVADFTRLIDIVKDGEPWQAVDIAEELSEKYGKKEDCVQVSANKLTCYKSDDYRCYSCCSGTQLEVETCEKYFKELKVELDDMVDKAAGGNIEQ